MLLVQFLGLFFIPSLLFAYFSDPNPGDYLGLKPPGNQLYWVWGVLAMLWALPLAEALGLLNQQINLGGPLQSWMKTMEEDAAKQVQFMVSQRTPKALFLNLFFIAVLAGVGEELFFRGVLQRLFIRITKNAWAGIIIAAILFSGFHLQFFGFLPRVLLGILLGAMYWYSGSLWVAIFAHFLYDAVLVTVLYANPEMAKDPNSAMMASSWLALLAAISAVLVYVVVRQMHKHSQTRFEDVYKEDFSTTEPLSF